MKKIVMVCLGLSVIGLTSLSAAGAGHGGGQSSVQDGNKGMNSSSRSNSVHGDKYYEYQGGGAQNAGSNAPSKVEVNKNINLNLVHGGSVKDSSVGMVVKGRGSEIQANRNTNLNLLNNSNVKNGSTVGMKIDAKGGKVKANDNVNLNLVKDSTVDSSDVGLSLGTE